MNNMKKKPYISEIAGLNSSVQSRTVTTDNFSGIIRREYINGRRFRNIYEVFNDMEDKDAHLYSMIQTRKNGLLSKPRKIIPASENPEDLQIARFVEKTISSIKNPDSALFNLLDAVSKGFAVLEIMWDISTEGNIIISELKSRFQGRFVFDENNNLQIFDPSEEYKEYLKKHSDKSDINKVTPQFAGIFHYYPHFSTGLQNADINYYANQPYPVPQNKFIVFSFNSQNENPYGRGLCLKAYWYYWFKKNNLKFWAVFNEKFGSPTVIGKYHPGTPESEKNKLLEIIASIQNDTGITIPDDISIDFLEAHRSGAINSYKDLAEWCNDEISKLVLGQTLTSFEGHRSGSLALGKVHEKVRFEYIESDSRALSNLLNSTLIKWITDYNFANVKNYPKLIIDISDPVNLSQEIEIDKNLVNLGVSIPIRHFYEKYNRPAPLNNEHSLRYDDNNLYQYHLQYGVLTINEVRESLGLPPVPYGNQPPVYPGEIDTPKKGDKNLEQYKSAREEKKKVEDDDEKIEEK